MRASGRFSSLLVVRTRHALSNRSLPGAVATMRHMSTVPPVLTTENVLEKWRENVPPSLSHVFAMYNHALGGIVTDPALMHVPVDDHGFHRGHCVFDTCNVKHGKAYGLDLHLERIAKSAKTARIPLSAKGGMDGLSVAELKDIVLHTLAVTGRRDGIFCRFWLTAGRGDFSVSPSKCPKPLFYVIVHEDPHDGADDVGVKAVTSDMPLKPPLLANTKSNNYMLNALLQMEAEDKGAQLSYQSEMGFLAESSVSSPICLGKDGYLRAPPFDKVLASTTMKRIFDLSASLVAQGLIKGLKQEPIPMEHLASCTELVDVGGGFCRPVVALDGVPVGDGSPGPVFYGLRAVLNDELTNRAHTTDIPYHAFA